MTEFGLSIRSQYSTITNPELDVIVREIQVQFPMCGNRQMQGHLLSRGYRIQQHGTVLEIPNEGQIQMVLL